MKYKLLITFFFQLPFVVAYSQNPKFEKPDYKIIEKEIVVETSNLYYPTLIKRFINSDTTMTLEEKRHLYYGYTFHNNYSPYNKSEFYDSLKVELNKETEIHEKKDLEKIIKFANLILDNNPFDLRAINYQLYALKKLENDKEYENRRIQNDIILKAIFSSGDGISLDTPFYVIYVIHEYNILVALGLEYGGEQRLIEQCDYLKVKMNTYQIKGLYFDVSASLNFLKKRFE